MCAAGHEVLTVDVRSPATLEPGEDVLLADMSNPEEVVRGAVTCRGTEYLIWLPAAIRQTADVSGDTHGDIRLMAQSPLSFLYELDPAPLACAYLSSIQVYGRPLRLPVGEDHPTDPFTAYGVSKLCGEQMLSIAGQQLGVPVACLRVAFVYGPGQHERNAIPQLLAAARKGRQPTVYEQGNGLRDDVYVGDVAEAVALSLEHRANGLFNIATGHPHTLGDVAESICAIAGVADGVRSEPGGSEWIDRYYEVDRARTSFDFEATTALEDGLQAMWNAPGR